MLGFGFFTYKSQESIIQLTSASLKNCLVIPQTDCFFIVCDEYQGTNISLIMKIQSHP